MAMCRNDAGTPCASRLDCLEARMTAADLQAALDCTDELVALLDHLHRFIEERDAESTRMNLKAIVRQVGGLVELTQDLIAEGATDGTH